MKLLLTTAFSALTIIAFAQGGPVGIFSNHVDVGNPAIKGSAQYDESTQAYTLKGGGYNIWFNRDEFHYLYKKIGGDFILTANFEFTGNDTGNAHKKFGWMVRQSLDDASAHISATYHREGLTVLQWRVMRGAYMRDPEDEIPTQKKHYQVIQLERSGKKFTMRVANWGEPLQDVGSHEMPDMPDSILAGLFICSHDSASSGEARIWNVRIDKPVPYTYSERAGALGSRLEIMNVFDGTRKVIREAPAGLKRPTGCPMAKNCYLMRREYYIKYRLRAAM